MTCCASCELEREVERIGHSPVLREGGARVYEGLVEQAVIAALLREAKSRNGRIEYCPHGRDVEQVRGGEPARRLISVEGGPIEDGLFRAPALSAFISGEVRASVRPCGERATFSIYCDADAHLDLHRDIRGCDLALITCLYDSDPHAAGGALETWPGELTTPLDELRHGKSSRTQRIALLPGESLLFHGGVVPHRIAPLSTHRLRIVAIMCFEVGSVAGHRPGWRPIRPSLSSQYI